MRELIQNKLNQIATEKNVRILLAVESGSRAWGFASEDSDYDVRFVYVHPLEYYLHAVGNTKDTIEVLEGDLDFSGWDILKTLSLANKSNPGLLEWLHSPIVYRISDFSMQLTALMNNYSKKALIHHYGSLAKRTWFEHLQKPDAALKKYFYAVRPILCVLYLHQKATFPPVDFNTLLKNLKLESDLRKEIDLLLEKKKESSEYTLVDFQLPVLRRFVEHWMDHYKTLVDMVTNVNPNTEALNQLGIDTILEREVN